MDGQGGGQDFYVTGAVGPGEALGASVPSGSGACMLSALRLPAGAQPPASDVLRYLLELYTVFLSRGCLCNYQHRLTGGGNAGWGGDVLVCEAFSISTRHSYN